MGLAISIAVALYIMFYKDIRYYFWSRKSDSEKYAEYRQFINHWNGTDY